MRLYYQQSEHYPPLHAFRTLPAGADLGVIMDPAITVITDPGGTMDLTSMSDLATATMVGGAGRLKTHLASLH
jgi:hypothetical protein